MLCLHHLDADGYCSAAALRYFLEPANIVPTFIECNYNNNLDAVLDEVKQEL